MVPDTDLSSPEELRLQVADLLRACRDGLVNDLASIFGAGIPVDLRAEAWRSVAAHVVDLFTTVLRVGEMDVRAGALFELHQIEGSRLGIPHLFSCVYFAERAALDELALDESIGATSEPWPAVAQFVRRASFDLLAAYCERVQLEPTDATLTDRLTTLYTRAVFNAVLDKEVQRASRFSHAIALMLFDLDRFSDINRTYGYGVGDRVLERMGILMRKFFRLQDWVARHGEDSIVVLLPETTSSDALLLAEGARAMVEARLAFRDHRSDRWIRVTVSASVVCVSGGGTTDSSPDFDGARLLGEAEAALDRAKAGGRNRVESVGI